MKYGDNFDFEALRAGGASFQRRARRVRALHTPPLRMPTANWALKSHARSRRLADFPQALTTVIMRAITTIRLTDRINFYQRFRILLMDWFDVLHFY